jgi:hypothetical protein
MGEEVDTMEEPQVRIEELLVQLTPETMQRVYEHWIERSQQAIHADRNHVSSQASSYQFCLCGAMAS